MRMKPAKATHSARTQIRSNSDALFVGFNVSFSGSIVN